ncbi:hypothetical protein [uncultured Draconibacterium sp.]|uniref:hypothetical protein n=1 Tax=uncultured Draconibacterium sp. TaxID=1573823 RepID=UPI0029C63DE9|nr:hypothetical protein [uncultured Draconibacterium sp.]
MKKLTLLLTILLVAGFAFAQDDYHNNEVETIFSNQKSNGGYGAFSVGYTQIDGRDAMVAGARGAFIFDHSFAIGLAGYGFVNDMEYHNYQANPEDRFFLAGGYGGVFFEPIVGGTKPVHVSFPIVVGMGGVSLVEHTGWDRNSDYYHDYQEYDTDLYFVFEPGVELEFNLTRFFRMAAYGSYRLTSDIKLYDTNPDVLRGFNVGMTFKFGKF